MVIIEANSEILKTAVKTGMPGRGVLLSDIVAGERLSSGYIYELTNENVSLSTLRSAMVREIKAITSLIPG